MHLLDVLVKVAHLAARYLGGQVVKLRNCLLRRAHRHIIGTHHVGNVLGVLAPLACAGLLGRAAALCATSALGAFDRRFRGNNVWILQSTPAPPPSSLCLGSWRRVLLKDGNGVGGHGLMGRRAVRNGQLSSGAAWCPRRLEAGAPCVKRP